MTTAHILTRAAVPHMLAHGGGLGGQHLVCRRSQPVHEVLLAYGTAKAALSHLTRLSAADLAPRIRVNAIAVGSVATSALEVVLTDDNLAPRHGAGHPHAPTR